MTTRILNLPERTTSAGDLQQRIRARIESLSYLPTTAAVAIKFVELGRNPDAEPADYAKVISADSSLSSKLLAVANSSWAGVRSKVTNIRMAVSLLGLGTVRTLAISYCMTGLHNELRLSPAESEIFWESSLYKAIAASRYATLFDAKLADEAFVCGLFQDLAIALMYSIVREPYLKLLQDPETGVAVQLEKERALFGIDHAEVGRALAQKLELPDLFVNTIAFHHNYQGLTDFVDGVTLRDATHAAALIPHAVNTWHRADADALTQFLQQHAPMTDMTSYVAGVQEDFATLYGFFNEGRTDLPQLADLLTSTAREVADNTTALVGTLSELIRGAAIGGSEVHNRIQRLEDQVGHDQLTGVLNRQGITTAAGDLLDTASRLGMSFAVCYLDIDKFKRVNDRFGHAFGDRALQAVVSATGAVLPREALMGRIGGDEFIIVFSGRGQVTAEDVARRIVANVSAKPVCENDVCAHLRVSIGLVYVRATEHPQPLEKLVSAADKLMYRAKQAGGNQFALEVI